MISHYFFCKNPQRCLSNYFDAMQTKMPHAGGAACFCVVKGEAGETFSLVSKLGPFCFLALESLEHLSTWTGLLEYC